MIDIPPPPPVIQNVPPSKEGLLSFLLSILSLLSSALGSFLLAGALAHAHNGTIAPANASFFAFYIIGTFMSLLGLSMAVNATSDIRPQVVHPLVGVALNGPLLVFNCLTLLVITIAASGLGPWG